MTDETPSPATAQTTAPAATVARAAAPPLGGLPASPPATQEQTASGAAQVASDRPELIVAGAFATGFVIALILKRLGN